MTGRNIDENNPTSNAAPHTPAYDTDDALTPMADAPTPEASNLSKKAESDVAPEASQRTASSSSAANFEEAATPRPPQEQRSAKGAGGDFSTWDVGDRYEVSPASRSRRLMLEMHLYPMYNYNHCEMF